MTVEHSTWPHLFPHCTLDFLKTAEDQARRFQNGRVSQWMQSQTNLKKPQSVLKRVGSS